MLYVICGMKNPIHYFLYDKHGNEVWKNDCINCLLDYTFKMITIISPVRGKCKHKTANYDGKTVFWFSKSGVIFPVILVLSNLFVATVQLLIILRACKVNRLLCLLEVHDQLLILNTVIWILFLTIKSKVRVQELNHISFILENKSFFGISKVIRDDYGRYVFRINHLNILVAGVCFLMFGCVGFISKGKEIFNYRDISLYFCQGIQVSISMQVSQKLVLMRVIYNAVGRTVRKHLNRAINKNGITESRLEDDLRKIILLSVECKEIMNEICDFINPSVIIWLTSHIALTVFNFFALIQVMTIQPVHLTVFGQIRTTISLLVIVSIFLDCQKISGENKKTMDFLFSFPLSKLSQMEGLLVEMLIDTLITHSPKVHASHIIIINMELTCTVIGSIITYLLVCLQFKPFN